MTVIIGVDAHKRTHTLVAVDDGGAKLGEKTIAATRSGHAAGLQWARSKFGPELTWGVEDLRSMTSLLERQLLAAKATVVRVPPHLMARNRGSKRAWGKSDAIDAIAVARAVLHDPALPRAVHDDISWELRMLVDRREDVVGQRVETINRLHGRLHQLAPERAKATHLERENVRQVLAEFLILQPGLTAELARQELRDIGYFTMTIVALSSRIVSSVRSLGSSLPQLPGCGELTAAKLIGEAANMDRFRSEAAFARYVGVAPVPASSGPSEGRVRASDAGNRQCNAAIHRIAVVQRRIDGPGRTYYQRRRDAGDTVGTATRSLKRRLCRIVYNRLRNDYKSRPRT